ncbi:MAG: 2OG-Fe(II) oxygenase [Cohaesibacter sp.]|nr:2OG-Fe(II) oxygenase [Cohaesibacter sp.]MCV6600461.1 2OG-Fe(II) oxygenase [Cohaesibacter sp.]
MQLSSIINLNKHPINEASYRAKCKKQIDETGALMLDGFLTAPAIEAIRKEGMAKEDQAYFCKQQHNVYLTPSDDAYPMDHPRNRQVISTKGCIPDDVIEPASPLRTLYDSDVFKSFLCEIFEESALYAYADTVSSINLHYARTGQELGWHFDNSSFAITLMIQETEAGGAFEYVADVRDADKGEMNFAKVGRVLDGLEPVETLSAAPGTLSLFRGRNSIHRVAPNEGEQTRMLVVLAYNSEPGIALSENARKTFYGRLD